MKTNAVEYNIILDADAIVVVLNTPVTYKRGRHTVSAEELADLQSAGAVCRMMDIVSHNAMMAGDAPNQRDKPQPNGYRTGAIFPE